MWGQQGDHQPMQRRQTLGCFPRPAGIFFEQDIASGMTPIFNPPVLTPHGVGIGRRQQPAERTSRAEVPSRWMM